MSTPRSASHRRGPRDTLHLTRPIHSDARTVRRTRCTREHKTRRHASPPTPHATQPGSNTQNRRTKCSPCTKTNPTTTPTTPHATHPRKNTPNRRTKCTREHKNQPHHHTNYTPRDTSKLKHAKPSHQVQSVYKNTGGPTPRVSPPALHVQRRSLTVESR